MVVKSWRPGNKARIWSEGSLKGNLQVILVGITYSLADIAYCPIGSDPCSLIIAHVTCYQRQLPFRLGFFDGRQVACRIQVRCLRVNITTPTSRFISPTYCRYPQSTPFILDTFFSHSATHNHVDNGAGKGLALGVLVQQLGGFCSGRDIHKLPRAKKSSWTVQSRHCREYCA